MFTASSVLVESYANLEFLVSASVTPYSCYPPASACGSSQMLHLLMYSIHLFIFPIWLPAAYSCGRGDFRAAAGQAKPGEISVVDAASGAATVQGGGHSAGEQDGPHRLGIVGQRQPLPATACDDVRRGYPMGK